MELEMKWRADEETQQRILNWSVPLRSKIIHYNMDATYYDTPDYDLAAEKAGLRLRTENDTAVCCLKCRGHVQDNGLHVREEYECNASEIKTGVSILQSQGAPAHFIELIHAKGLIGVCRITYNRTAILLSSRNAEGEICCTAELALDQGILARNERKAPLSEVELELKSGNETAFHDLAGLLARTFNLQPEPLSKLARATAL